jgi:hypothetical protein
MGFVITIKVNDEFENMKKKKDVNLVIKENLTKQLVALAALDPSILVPAPDKPIQELVVELVEDIVDELADAVVNIVIAEAALQGTTEQLN